MAQLAVPVAVDQTDMLAVPIFWLKPASDPPSSWDFWIGQI